MPHKDCNLLVKQGQSVDWIALKVSIPQEVSGILLGVNPDSAPGEPIANKHGVNFVPLIMDIEAPLPFRFKGVLTVESETMYEV